MLKPYTAENMRRMKARKALFPKSKTRPETFANIGRNHPHYGMTPSEHATAKAETN